ncbi:hypothetical protein CORC01_07229 [Colletotrichum orchidophilum]|uniref:Uncharacterized protein n=1 Tax=Colletotrichum orchidophilum TaxID=1209926 RepID=A0A1G4B7R2_9PEZI|nr:uncharacterized protein CORC01_07229 [Colletotrichum orchidophilum]OHE97447.1 hypothetical protein CORC01_07229 [Colletotrichum orchidophilum]
MFVNAQSFVAHHSGSGTTSSTAKPAPRSAVHTASARVMSSS